MTDFPVGYFDTPIFWSLISEERFSGLDFPVKIVVNRQGRVINYLSSYSTGIEPMFSQFIRTIRFPEDDPIYKIFKEHDEFKADHS